MFSFPDAKRIRRDEVYFRSSLSPSPPPEPVVKDGYELLGRVLDLYPTLDTVRNDESALEQSNELKDAKKQKNKDEEQEFEFRLFSAPVSRKSDVRAAHQVNNAKGQGERSEEAQRNGELVHKLRIRIRSPTPVSGDTGIGRFVNPFRGWPYYFSTPALLDGSRRAESEAVSSSKKRQIEGVAVSGEQLLNSAKLQAWPGCNLPWRVIHLKRHETKLPPASNNAGIYSLESPPVSRSPKSRKKPGKKRRIQLRKRLVAAQKAQETEAEKRNRKNRERKIKRRQKAREAKAAIAVAGNQSDQVGSPALQRVTTTALPSLTGMKRPDGTYHTCPD